MKLTELFSYLTYGELANLKVGGKDDGGIYPKYSDEVKSFIQLGLTALHTRFSLKHNEVIVQQFDEVTMYRLTYDYAVSNLISTEPNKWVSDSEANPFREDIILIEEIYDEEGTELYINNETQEASIFTPEYNLLQFVQPVASNAVAVIYKADHDKLDLNTYKPSEIDIHIPSSLTRALCLYISSLAHTAVGSPEGMQTGLTKMQEYEAAVFEAELRGAVHKEEWDNNRIWRDGWA